MCTTSARTMTIHAAANVGNLYHTRDKWCKRKDQRILPSTGSSDSQPSRKYQVKDLMIQSHSVVVCA